MRSFLRARARACKHANMHVVALLAQKGGVGKTTLAVSLAVQSGYNMEALAATVRLVKQVRKPGFFVINRGNRSKAINDECALALTSAYGLPAVNTHVLQRQPIADGELLGMALPEMGLKDLSADKGKDEFRALWSWLVMQLEGEKDHG